MTPEPFDDGVTGMIDRMIGGFSQHPVTAWITFDVVEFTANIGMFVPLGLLVALWAGKRRWWVGIIVGFGYTVVIETTQGLVLSATRYATLSDVVANTLGAIIGAVISIIVFAAIGARTVPQHSRSRVR